MKHLAILAASALSLFAVAPASAATVTSTTVGNIGSNTTIFADFDTVTPTPSGGLLQVSPPEGIPGQAAPVGTGNFGYVVGNSNVSFTLDRAARELSFDAGSIDPYNFVNLDFSDGTSQAFGGPFGAFSPSDSARLIFTAGTGQKITGFTLGSGANSFEFDNIGLAGVPEPATWGLMILGFGMVGGAMRRRSGKVSTAARFA